MYYRLWLGSGIRPPRTIPLGPRKLQVKAFQTAFGQMQGCADFMRLWRNFMPRQFSSRAGFVPRFVGGGAEVMGAADELARKAVPITSAP